MYMYLSVVIWLMCVQLRGLSPDEFDSFKDKLSSCKDNCFVILSLNCIPLPVISNAIYTDNVLTQ